MAELLPGCYQHEKSDNLEQFLAERNVPLIARKVVANTSPRLEISREGLAWNITFKVLIKTNTITFKIGEEFSETNPLSSDTSKAMRSVATITDHVLCAEGTDVTARRLLQIRLTVPCPEDVRYPA